MNYVFFLVGLDVGCVCWTRQRDMFTSHLRCAFFRSCFRPGPVQFWFLGFPCRVWLGVCQPQPPSPYLFQLWEPPLVFIFLDILSHSTLVDVDRSTALSHRPRHSFLVPDSLSLPPSHLWVNLGPTQVSEEGSVWSYPFPVWGMRLTSDGSRETVCADCVSVDTALLVSISRPDYVLCLLSYCSQSEDKVEWSESRTFSFSVLPLWAVLMVLSGVEENLLHWAAGRTSGQPPRGWLAFGLAHKLFPQKVVVFPSMLVL